MRLQNKSNSLNLQIVVVLRVSWGGVGPHYARFSQFVLGPKATFAYARAFAARAEPRYVGHNPLGGWMIESNKNANVRNA